MDTPIGIQVNLDKNKLLTVTSLFLLFEMWLLLKAVRGEGEGKGKTIYKKG